MPEIVSACPLCGKGKSTLFDTMNFKGIVVENRLCSDCGLVFQSPRMTQQEAEDFYAREYRLLYQGQAEITSYNLRQQQARARHLAGFVQKAGVKPTCYLEIGASAGILMKEMKRLFQCQAVGIEPSHAYRQQAEEEGLVMYPVLESFDAKNTGKYDLLALSHVLEHINEPAGLLASVREKHLTPEAYLVIEVPNLYGHDCFEPAHAISFSLHTLNETLRQAGFTTVSTRVHGEPRSGNIPLYLTVLAQVSPALAKEKLAVQPESAVAIKRKFGLLKRRIMARFFRKEPVTMGQ
jgi:2-polyprenyl-3-methyl-5-hydroxy-6-metoxy-1,4-benzoquinol methylase